MDTCQRPGGCRDGSGDRVGDRKSVYWVKVDGFRFKVCDACASTLRVLAGFEVESVVKPFKSRRSIGVA